MSEPGSDGLVDLLGQLSVAPPRSLADRLVARWTRVSGPIGDLYVAFTDEGISFARPARAVDDSERVFAELCRARLSRPLQPAERPPVGLADAVRTGRTRSLRFDLRGVGAFERDVLDATLTIPVGETRSYAWVAGEIGRPRAVRAVGSALGRNPVPVLIPCHRVIRSDGSPGQYLFGPDVKESLLRAERQRG
jgi:O-6-methylguanine DNA methyltransferase